MDTSLPGNNKKYKHLHQQIINSNRCSIKLQGTILEKWTLSVNSYIVHTSPIFHSIAFHSTDHNNTPHSIIVRAHGDKLQPIASHTLCLPINPTAKLIFLMVIQ